MENEETELSFQGGDQKLRKLVEISGKDEEEEKKRGRERKRETEEEKEREGGEKEAGMEEVKANRLRNELFFNLFLQPKSE